jgi:hypothetical protein
MRKGSLIQKVAQLDLFPKAQEEVTQRTTYGATGKTKLFIFSSNSLVF